LRGAVSKIHEKGAEFVVIGNGTPFMASAFREEVGLETPLYTDPTLTAYKLAGFKYGARHTFSLKAIWHGIRAFRAGFRQTKTQGAPLQQGGVLVVRKGGEIIYGYASNEAGDHPPVEDILSAVEKV
jgi:hypothetical protein